MEIQTLSLGPLGTNCYIVSNQGDCVIIDPGGDAHIVTKYVTDNALDVKAILLTHAHFDHIGAVDELRKHYEVDVYLHEAEESWLVDANLNRSAAFMGSSYHIETAKPEQILTEGPLTIGTITCEVVHTPGHSPGSVSFIFADAKFTVSGDVLFQQSIGRTDLPGGDMQVLAKSIVHKLYTLSDDFIVYPGHGPSTSIGSEKQRNPFTLQFYQA
ncbi:MAG TPA: MBL fold metallo-hydrolase, partial [Pseudogracilibacillus sp.]|nr:MBL fold metallo-hydrolase [Pseudogracilibacillus sp.]